ncbi:MAG: CoA-binding protein [Burkholderiaceae bacterium]|nr:CoA-binding protein [Burkholderiaceae bacterium]
MSIEISELLQKTKTIAVVGLSDKPDRPSYDVARYMQAAGYKIIPVNPNCQSILGMPCYPDLKSIPQKIDMVNVFRRAEDCLPITQEAIALGVGSIWLQLGIHDEASVMVAQKANIPIITNRCLKIEHRLCKN